MRKRVSTKRNPRTIHHRYSVDLEVMFRSRLSSEQLALLKGLVCEVLEKHRKNSSLTIKKSMVLVSVPVGTSFAWIEQWILSHEGWLLQKVQHMRNQNDGGFQIVQGASVPINGLQYTLSWHQGTSTSVELGHRSIIVSLSLRGKLPEAVRVERALKQFLRELAFNRLHKSYERWVAYMDAKPTGLVIKDYKARWGSCSSGGEISLNWRLVHAPDYMLDYVIVHELCHLKHFNHSPQFWAEIDRWYGQRHQAQAAFEQSSGWLTW